jgi:hypothetical protein
MGSFIEGFGDPSTHTSTPKFVEEVAIEVMKTDKVVELFQTMVIVSINMGNLTLEVNTLKNILATWERKKELLQEELDKERDFQKGYKYNVEIWKNNKAKVE